MISKRSHAVLAGSLLFSTPLTAQVAAPIRPVGVRAPSPATEAAEVRFGSAERSAFVDAHARGDLMVLDLPMPGSGPVTLLLQPFEVWEPGGTAVVVDEGGVEDRVAPSIRLFRGTLAGRPGTVVLGIAEGFVHGWLEHAGLNYQLDTGPPDSARLRIEAVDDEVDASLCSTEGVQRGRGEARGSPPPVDGEPLLLETDLFIEMDRWVRKEFASDQEAVDYTTLLVGASGEIFRRDIGISFRLPDGYVRLWNTNSPWGTTADPYDRLGLLQETWESQPESPAAVVVLGRGQYAYEIGSACDRSLFFCFASVRGRITYPFPHTGGRNWDLYVFSHEAGHVLGAMHASYLGIECEDGSGPDQGTLMANICRARFGNSKMGMRFHPLIQQGVRETMEAAPCIRHVPILPGDYDANGVVDLVDLAWFEAFGMQGFSSLGSEAVFDLNADGVVDAVDHALLRATIGRSRGAAHGKGR